MSNTQDGLLTFYKPWIENGGEEGRAMPIFETKADAEAYIEESLGGWGYDIVEVNVYTREFLRDHPVKDIEKQFESTRISYSAYEHRALMVQIEQAFEVIGNEIATSRLDMSSTLIRDLPRILGAMKGTLGNGIKSFKK